MSRIAKEPVQIPAGVELDISGRSVVVKGPKGHLNLLVHPTVQLIQEDQAVTVRARNSSAKSRAMSGTMRSLIQNMVTGVTKGYQKNLTLIGTGYRAKVNGATLNLSLGFSHPITYKAPKDISFRVTSETSAKVEMVVEGIDKQVVGQVAADIRAFRPPEPYKGKGVRYADEWVRMKQAKSIG